MKTTLFATLILLAFALASNAQTTDNTTTSNPDPTVSILSVRTGVRTDAPHSGTYHYVEFFQLRGNWIYPDFGYIDFNGTGYREVSVGAGRTLYHSDRATIAEELYFDQAVGPDAKSARYLQPWTLVDLNITKKLTTETVYFPYLPLNQSARIQHVLERAKVEYQVAKHVKVGGGYAGYKYGDGEWQSKPMIATTVSTKAGSFEFWLQKMPGGGQVQIRYTLVHTAHR